MDKYKSLFVRSLDDNFNYNSIEAWTKEFNINKSILNDEFNSYAIYIAKSFLNKDIDFWQADQSLWHIMGILDHNLPKIYWEIAIEFENYEEDDNPDKNIINSLKLLLERLEKQK